MLEARAEAVADQEGEVVSKPHKIGRKTLTVFWVCESNGAAWSEQDWKSANDAAKWCKARPHLKAPTIYVQTLPRWQKAKVQP